MEAKTFISKKHDAAVAELKALEAEFAARSKAAKEMISLTEKFLNELADEKIQPAPEAVKQQPTKLTIVDDELVPETVMSSIPKAPSETWISARDLLPRVRQAS